MNGIFDTELQKRSSAIAYGISRAVSEHFQGKAVIDTMDGSFDIAEFAAAGHCTLAGKPGVHCLIKTQWVGGDEPLLREPCAGWFTVTWRNHEIEVLTASWFEFYREINWNWIAAEDAAVAEDFFSAVCEWCNEIRGEVLVFSQGSWQ